MRAEPKDDEETHSTDPEAGKDAETTGTFDVSCCTKLDLQQKFGYNRRNK